MEEPTRKFNILVLLFLLSFQEKMEQVEATKTCEALSRFFLGFCLFDHHCEMACKIETYTTGKCLGFKPRCICLKTCYQPSPPQTPLPPPATPPAPPPKTPKPPCARYPPYKDPPQTPNPPQSTPPYPTKPSKHLHLPKSDAKPSRILKSRHLPRSPVFHKLEYSSKWCRENKYYVSVKE